MELSNQATPCSLNILDIPCQEETPALLGCATATEHHSPWAAASYEEQAHFGCSINNNSESGMAVSLFPLGSYLAMITFQKGS